MKTKASQSNKSLKKKTKKVLVESALVHVQASFNNTIITITDLFGNALVSLSAGMLKFKGAKKSTAFASQITASTCAKKAIEQYGVKMADVYIKGPGLGRESAIRAIQNSGINIKIIKDVTPIPHNGCRPPKKRRV